MADINAENLDQSSERKSGLRDKLRATRQDAFERFPLVFTLLGTFGLVATLYGFEGVLDRLPFIADNPLMMLILGVVILVGTGTLYRQLSAGRE